MCTQTHTKVHKHLNVYETKIFIFRVDKLLKWIKEGFKIYTFTIIIKDYILTWQSILEGQ